MLADDFIFDNFKLALDYLKGQFSRLWQRFNFFLTVQMALFGFFGWLAFEKDNLPATRLVCMLGVFISALWYIVAAQDRALVEIYRERLEKTAKKLAQITSLNSPDYGTDFVGIEAPSQFRTWCVVWYCRPLSITILPVWLALLHLLVWMALLAVGTDWLEAISRKPT